MQASCARTVVSEMLSTFWRSRPSSELDRASIGGRVGCNSFNVFIIVSSNQLQAAEEHCRHLHFRWEDSNSTRNPNNHASDSDRSGLVRSACTVPPQHPFAYVGRAIFEVNARCLA